MLQVARKFVNVSKKTIDEFNSIIILSEQQNVCTPLDSAKIVIWFFIIVSEKNGEKDVVRSNSENRKWKVSLILQLIRSSTRANFGSQPSKPLPNLATHTSDLFSRGPHSAAGVPRWSAPPINNRTPADAEPPSRIRPRDAASAAPTLTPRGGACAPARRRDQRPVRLPADGHVRAEGRSLFAKRTIERGWGDRFAVFWRAGREQRLAFL